MVECGVEVGDRVDVDLAFEVATRNVELAVDDLAVDEIGNVVRELQQPINQIRQD